MLQAMPSEERSKILLDVADALEASEKLIIAENEADVAEAEQAGYDKSLISRLALKPGKVRHCQQSYVAFQVKCCPRNSGSHLIQNLS